LDAMIQLGLLACHGGQTDRATTAFVPIHLSKLNLRSGLDEASGMAVAHGVFKGQRSAYLQLQLQDDAGDVVLDMQDLRCISYSLEAASSEKGRTKAFSSPFTRMVYKPDFRVLSSQQARAMLPPPPKNSAQGPVLAQLESIGSLVAVDVAETLLNR
jgi:hypothetical protein